MKIIVNVDIISNCIKCKKIQISYPCKDICVEDICLGRCGLPRYDALTEFCDLNCFKDIIVNE